MATKGVTHPTVAELVAEITAAKHGDDPGHTMAELAQARFGNANAHARNEVSKMLRVIRAEGRLVQGWRWVEDLSGRAQRVSVFRMINKAR